MFTTSPMIETYPARLRSVMLSGSACSRRFISSSPSCRASRSFWTTAKRSWLFSRRNRVPASARVRRRASVRMRSRSVERSRSLLSAIPIWTSSLKASVRLTENAIRVATTIPDTSPLVARLCILATMERQSRCQGVPRLSEDSISAKSRRYSLIGAKVGRSRNIPTMQKIPTKQFISQTLRRQWNALCVSL